LIDVISHHVDKGGSPVEAAEAMRAAFDGSIKSVAADHWKDRAISCVTVFGGTGFIGRCVVQHLRDSGVTVRIASRHPGQSDGDDVEQIRADAHDGRSSRLLLRAPMVWSTRLACTSSTEAKHSVQFT
jgi:hypothetical protein